MTIKVGDKLPDGKLMETTEFDSGTQCAMAPKEVNVGEAAKGKKIAVFGLPGAYTPTCSAKHVPGYVQNMDALKKKGVSEVWCVATNDAFVMAHWGKDAEGAGQDPLPRRRQRAMGQGARPGARPQRPRHGHAHEPLLDAGRQRRGEEPERRGPRQVRGVRRRHHAEAAGLDTTRYNWLSAAGGAAR